MTTGISGEEYEFHNVSREMQLVCVTIKDQFQLDHQI